METEKEKNLAEYEHLQSTEVCERLTEKVVLLEKKHKSAIKKSRYTLSVSLCASSISVVCDRDVSNLFVVG